MLLVDALGRCRTPDAAWRRAELLLSRAVMAQASGAGDREQIYAYFEEATQAARLAGHDRARARAVVRRVLTDVPRGRGAGARAEIEELFQCTDELGDRRGAAMSALVAAVLALDDGEQEASSRWLLRCLDIATAIGYWHAVAWSVMGATMLAIRTGRLAQGARLHGGSHGHLDVMSIATPPAQLANYQRAVAMLRDGLGDEFEAQCLLGQRRTWNETVGEARQVIAETSVDVTTRPAGTQHRRRGPRANPELTDRELDVLAALTAGHTNREVADALGISPKTVMHHTVSVYRKLAVRGRAEAIAHALRTGLAAS
jgi:DNA-binding CsgD family transcriptional regulator